MICSLILVDVPSPRSSVTLQCKDFFVASISFNEWNRWRIYDIILILGAKVIMEYAIMISWHLVQGFASGHQLTSAAIISRKSESAAACKLVGCIWGWFLCGISHERPNYELGTLIATIVIGTIIGSLGRSCCSCCEHDSQKAVGIVDHIAAIIQVIGTIFTFSYLGYQLYTGGSTIFTDG